MIGLAAALGLAVLAAHPRVRGLEKRLGVTVLISAGLPFLAMGAIFRLPEVGVLNDEILGHLRPAFEFGLGWIGFVVGMQFEVRTLDRLPRQVGALIAISTAVPILTTAGLCSIAYLDLGGEWAGAAFARDALVLAACAAPSAAISVDAWTQRVGVRSAKLLGAITRFDEVVALALLGVVAILFRPDDAATQWKLPSASAWLLVTLGLGVVLGALTYVLLRGARTAAEELSVLLGAVAISAGMAGYLALSVPVVCAIAGALLANLPMRDRKGFQQILVDVERPLYLVFLVVVGASWRPGEWQGWIIAPAFVLARVAGKRLGAIWSTRLGVRDLPRARDVALALAPQSPIAVVAIVSAATLYRGVQADRIRWAVNAVIIGGVITELVVRLLERRDRISNPPIVEPPVRVSQPSISELGRSIA